MDPEALGSRGELKRSSHLEKVHITSEPQTFSLSSGQWWFAPYTEVNAQKAIGHTSPGIPGKGLGDYRIWKIQEWGGISERRGVEQKLRWCIGSLPKSWAASAFHSCMGDSGQISGGLT